MIDVVLLKDQPEAVYNNNNTYHNQKPSVIKLLFPDQTTATSDWRIWQLVRDLRMPYDTIGPYIRDLFLYLNRQYRVVQQADAAADLT